MLSATAFEHNGISYFLQQSEPAIERFDALSEQWLEPISLSGFQGTPTVAYADDDGIYVSFYDGNGSLHRFDLDGSNHRHIITWNSPVHELYSDGNVLFVNRSSSSYIRFTSFNKTTWATIDVYDWSGASAFRGGSISREQNRIVGRSTGYIPSEIVGIWYSDNGEFLRSYRDPYHGDYDHATNVWGFPGGSKVVDNVGNIYAINNLMYLGSFASDVTDIAFYDGEIPVVLDESSLQAYGANGLPTVGWTLTAAASHIAANETSIIAFIPDAGSAHGYTTEIVPYSQFAAPVPAEAPDPDELAFVPDEISLANDGRILVHSKSHRAIFFWNPMLQTYDGALSTVGAAEYMTYSSATNRIYLAYASGLIQCIDLNSAEPVEVPFTVLTGAALGLSTAGQYLFAVDSNGAWGTGYYTFHPDGTRISAVKFAHRADEFLWSEANQKMYFVPTSVSPVDIYSEEIDANGSTYPTVPAGGIGVIRDSPFHGEPGFMAPVRVSPNGSVALLGSGFIHDARTLERLPQSLPNSILDATWMGGGLFTLRDLNGATLIQRRSSSTYALEESVHLPGAPHALVTLSANRLLAITIDDQAGPHFFVLDAGLEIIPRPVPVADAGPDVAAIVRREVLLEGSKSYDPDELPTPLTYQWTIESGPTLATFSNATASTTVFLANEPGHYQIRLTVSDGVYSDSDVIEVTASLTAGDYNNDGDVDITDYVVWRNALDTNVPNWTGADGDGDGIVGPGDYRLWKSNFGEWVPIRYDDNDGGDGSGSGAPLDANLTAAIDGQIETISDVDRVADRQSGLEFVAPFDPAVPLTLSGSNADRSGYVWGARRTFERAALRSDLALMSWLSKLPDSEYEKRALLVDNRDHDQNTHGFDFQHFEPLGVRLGKGPVCSEAIGMRELSLSTRR
jgi:hypothetical protein